MNEKKHKGTNAASVHKSFQQQIVPRCVHYLYIYFGRKTIKISEKSVIYGMHIGKHITYTQGIYNKF